MDVTERMDGDEQGDTLERLVGITDGVELKKKKRFTRSHTKYYPIKRLDDQPDDL